MKAYVFSWSKALGAGVTDPRYVWIRAENLHEAIIGFAKRTGYSRDSSVRMISWRAVDNFKKFDGYFK